MKKIVITALSLSYMLNFSEVLYSLDKEMSGCGEYTTTASDSVKNSEISLSAGEDISGQIDFVENFIIYGDIKETENPLEPEQDNPEETAKKDETAKKEEPKPVITIVKDKESEEMFQRICFENHELLNLIEDEKQDHCIKFYALADLFLSEIKGKLSESEPETVAQLLSCRQKIAVFFNYIYNRNLCRINEIIFGTILIVRAISSHKKQEVIKSSTKDVLGTFLLIGMMLSNKFNADISYRNSVWAKNLQVPLGIINTSELTFLNLIEFSCNVTEEEFREKQDYFIMIYYWLKQMPQ